MDDFNEIDELDVLDELPLDIEILDGDSLDVISLEGDDAIAAHFGRQFMEADELFGIDLDDAELVSLDDGETDEPIVPADGDSFGFAAPAVIGGSETRIAQRIMIPVEDTLNRYAEKLKRVLRIVQGSDQNAKALEEVNRRLIAYYQEHNDVFPDMLVYSEYDEVSGKLPEGVKIGKKYINDNLDTYIVTEIQNGRGARALFDVVAKLVEARQMVDSKNRPFRLDEIRALEFLNKMKAFYESDLETYAQDNSRRQLVQAQVSGNVKYFMTLATKENAPIIVSPRRIAIGNGTFICGSCGDEAEYSSPFMQSVLLNSGGSDFLTFLPTAELCTHCGFINMLPQNYLQQLSENIWKIFTRDVDVVTLREKLERLGGAFSRYSYDLPLSVIKQAVPDDMKFMFEFEDEGDYLEEQAEQTGFAFDPNHAAEQYMRKVRTLRQTKRLDLGRVTSAERNLYLADNFVLKLDLTGPAMSSIARIFCLAVGSDYGLLKNKAVSSFLFFLEDHVPYPTNPYLQIREQASVFVGLQELDVYSAGLSEYQAMIDGIEKNIDCFAFVPITSSVSRFPRLAEFGCDKRMRGILDYVSDMMIVYSLRKDLAEMCVVGLQPPFLGNMTMKKVLESPMDESAINKFVRAVSSEISAEYRVTDIAYTRRNWLQRKWKDCLSHGKALDAFQAKDLYGLYEAVSGDARYGDSGMMAWFDPIRDRLEGKGKLEFYYGHLFPGEDFEKYSTDGIRVFCIPQRKDGETFGEYLTDIRLDSESSRKAKVSDSAWFTDRAKDFIRLLCDDLLARQKPSDVLFMDIVKNMSVFGVAVIAQAFGIDRGTMGAAMDEFAPFEYPAMDPGLALATQILYQYPYKNEQLQSLLGDSDDDPESFVRAVMSDTDSLADELASAPKFVKDLLNKQFGLDLR